MVLEVRAERRDRQLGQFIQVARMVWTDVHITPFWPCRLPEVPSGSVGRPGQANLPVCRVASDVGEAE
jgi:hypothetical protein